MASIPCKTNPMGNTKENYFSLIVKPGILGDMEYGFTPYWNAGGYCKVLDWGDGIAEDAVTSGTVLTHTYSVAGTYKIKIAADCYQVVFGGSANPGTEYAKLIFDSNGNWEKLGNITSATGMFSHCVNAEFRFSHLPNSLVRSNFMFWNCKKSPLLIKMLPSGIVNSNSMFRGCSVANFLINELPSGITNGYYMFEGCALAEFLFLTRLPSGLTNADHMFSGCANALLPLVELPSGLTNCYATFQSCKKFSPTFSILPNTITNGRSMFSDCASLSITIANLPKNLIYGQYMFFGCLNLGTEFNSLPLNLQDAISMFYNCKKAEINISELADIGEEYNSLLNISYMFYSSPNVTGSRSAFLAKCPNVTNTTNAFTGTNTTE